MRILSARILRARRCRESGQVAAIVSLMLLREGAPLPLRIDLRVSASARAPGAAPLRGRLLAAAKLACATMQPHSHSARRAA